MSAPTPIVVTGCIDCPFCSPLHCEHHDFASRLGKPWDGGGTPSWCPLRTSPALVVLRPEGLKSPPLDGTG